MNGLSEFAIRLFELAKTGVLRAEVPLELEPTLDFYLKTGHVALVTKQGPEPPQPKRSHKLVTAIKRGNVVVRNLRGHNVTHEVTDVAEKRGGFDVGVHVSLKGVAEPLVCPFRMKMTVLDGPVPDRKSWVELTLNPLGDKELSRHRMIASGPEAKSGEPPPKHRTGRPRKGDSDKERLVIGALAKHHRYHSDGSVENHTPAKTKRLAELASGKHVKVSVATVSRFFGRKFHDHDRGYDGYVAACNRDARVNIGMLIALWQGDIPKRLAGLLSRESGHEDAD